MFASFASNATTKSRPSLPANPFRLMATGEPWLALLFMITSFVIGLFWFIVLVVLISVGGSLAVTLIGLPILVGAMYAWIGGAKAERWRVGAMLGEEIRDPYQPIPVGVSFWQHIWRRAKDGHTWLDLLYLFLLFPIGVAEFVIATVVVYLPFQFLLAPVWYWADTLDWFGPDWFGRIGAVEAFGLALVGVPLLLLMPYVLVGIGRGHAHLAKALLGTDRERELTQQVTHLTASRTQAVDVSLSERRRIERDLHDGAQQQLVKLAMDLGMAREKIESDPAAAQALIVEAHEESKRALVEIRNLVRGIHPAVLTDRGLDAAVSALAGRSTIPVSVDVRLEERPSEAIESAAYFVVAESLTNIARHSQATEALVRIYRLGSRLLVEIIDNGVGGATIGKGTGLSGLADRVGALDGRLTVDSPDGGPTTVRADLPLS